METVGIYEARTRLSEIIDKVRKGEEVTVTRHGVPVARIIPVDGEKKMAVRDAIAAMKKFGRGKSLKGLSLKKMIEEGENVSGFVLDASVTMAWCFAAQSDAYCENVLEALDTDRAIAPEIWILEIVNTLVVSERRGRLLAAQSEEFLDTLWGLSIDVEPAASRTSWSREVLLVARANGLSGYDAAYLELAKRKSLPLATRDQALRRAAIRSGVALFLDSTE